MRIELSQEDEEKIFSLVERVVGTKRLAKQKSRLIINNIKKRMHVTGCVSLDTYLAITKKNKDESRFLLSNLTIHTTYWFRENVNIELFTDWVKKYAQSKDELRGLSVGCSTGQEVFSIALVLESIGLRYKFRGIDVDPISIETAKKGVFPDRELSSIPSELHKFVLLGSGRTKDLFTLDRSLRNRCEFAVENATSLKLRQEYYDFIFCRNMLIYFDEKQVKKIVEHFATALAPGGMLILGVSESLTNSITGIDQLRPAVFQKRGLAENKSKAQNPNTKTLLIVEDSKTIQKQIKSLMSSVCYDTVVASSLKEADAVLAKRQADAISLDVNLPDGNGLDWLKKNRNHGLKIPVAVLSGISENDRSLFLEVFRSGITEFYPKDILQGDPSKYQLFLETFLGVEVNRTNSKMLQKILLVDDDPTILEILSQLLSEHGFEPISFDNSRKALDYLNRGTVDAILTDYMMPEFNGIDFISRARKIHSGIPAMVISGHLRNRQDIKNRYDINVIDKPIDEFSFINGVKELLNSKPQKIDFSFFLGKNFPCIAIGSSTGGPQTLKRVLGKLPPRTPPIVIVQHIPQKFQSKFFRDLAEESGLQHVVVDREVEMKDNHLYSSEPGKHVCLKQRGNKVVAFAQASDDGSGHTPSVNKLFSSAASLRDKCLAVLLTGMGSDGAAAMKYMRSKGHYTVAQDESAIVYGMPRAAAEAGAVCFAGSDWDIQRLFSYISKLQQ